VPRTSTFALNNATLPFVLALADKGLEAGVGREPASARGPHVSKGHVTYKAVADSLGYKFKEPALALA